MSISAKRIANFIASPALFFYTAIWLLIILVAGTIAQKYVGLYVSQHTYFSSWFFSEWKGIPILDGLVLPAPGGRFALTIMFFNLLTKLIFKSPWRWDRAGTLIAHGGGLLLLIGGFFTAYFSKEGNMLLFEGDGSANFADYHELEFAVIDRSPEEYNNVVAFRNEYIRKGAIIDGNGIPGKITIKEFYRNASVLRADSPAPADHKGLAQRFKIAPKELEPQFERNQAAMIVELSGFGQDDGVYYLLQGMRIPQLIESGGITYQLDLRNARYVLPFRVELIDFIKRMHPGTETAKDYRSIVNVYDGDTRRRVEISMNQPLVKDQYIFYQASFIPVEEGEREASVLAVVRNAGRNYPYISSVIMCIGLMIHILLRLPNLMRKRTA